MFDKGICDKGFIWNPSICECECDKLYDIRQYLDWKFFELDWKSCECRKKLLDKLKNVVKILMEMKWSIMEL